MEHDLPWATLLPHECEVTSGVRKALPTVNKIEENMMHWKITYRQNRDRLDIFPERKEKIYYLCYMNLSVCQSELLRGDF